jgi:hypothetical protein
MKKIKYFTTFLVIMLIMLFMTSCGKNTNAKSNDVKGIIGSWAYTHDKEKAIAVFHKNGTAQYEGNEYSFECDSQFIKLKNKDGKTLKLRYLLNDKGMYLYSNTTYTFSGKGEPDGLVGEWSCAEKNWSYSFTEEGTFEEDGFFSGNYTVDDKNSTFKMVYDDKFEDTVCYFQIHDGKLQIEYPWPMVKISNK